MPTICVIGFCMFNVSLVLSCMIDTSEAGSVTTSPEQKKRKCGGIDDECFVHP